MNYKGKTVLVAGAGRSGIAAARFLLGRGARVVLSDSKTREALEPAVSDLLESAADSSGELTLELGGNRRESFAAADLVVVSPGMPLSLPFFEISRKAGIPVIAEIELAYRHLKGKIIGITGSNGKTTTTTLTAELLTGAGIKARAAGNIGTPLIQFVDGSTPEDVYVVELSSFQLEAIAAFRPFAATLLNLTPDHMDRYDGFEEYVAAKARIFMNQAAGDFAVLNADDQQTASIINSVRVRPLFFSRTGEIPAGVFIRNRRVIFHNGKSEKELFPVDAVRIKGAHNMENVLASSLLALCAGAPPESLEAGIRKFNGVEHRLEHVASIGGVSYFNDSKATNVDAVIKALEAFPGRIHLIAGGRDKGGDFTVLRPVVGERVTQLILIGEAAGKMRRALSGAADIREAASMSEAVKAGRAAARPGDVVLLAPACASFDMFENFEHRGRAFKDAVLALNEDNQRQPAADHKKGDSSAAADH
ncbi:MAG: UDP-N-acetylmuramoyl-L-alanine--D-glutamate ligase [Acidobacteriota bacterium]|nr:UDP-N-acetylmuramoyl-L-alanine--D-glutamate ligase [Acidobacteriota bacterium]